MESRTKNQKNMLRSFLPLARVKKSRSYSLNNQIFKIEATITMVVTKSLKMVAAHIKQSLLHLVNIEQNTRTGARGTGADVTNTGP